MKLIIILCFAYALFVHSLGNITLWDPDEPRQAIMAREMMERGDYLHPYLNGSPYTEKPPLHPWLIILASKVQGGLNEAGARLPSAILASALMVMVYLAGRRMADDASGFLASLVLATNYQFMSNGREAVMDMAFAFFIGASVFLAWYAVERDSRRLMVLAFVPAALAVLTKGPAGLFLPVAVTAIYLVVARRVSRFALPLVAGCLISAGLASIWFFLAGREYAQEFLIHQNLVRYARGFDHIENAFYYFHKLFFNFLPWSILLPFALIHACRRRLWLPLIWFLFTFLFFEFSRSKRAIYLLPCYAACALIVGVYVKDRWAGLVTGSTTGLLLRLFGIMLFLLPVAALLVAPRLRDFPLLFPEGPAPLYLAAPAVAILGGLFLYTMMKGLPRGALATFVTYLLVCGIVHHSVYMPALDRNVKSARIVIDAIGPTDADVYMYHINSPALIYYLKRPIRIIREPREIGETGKDVIVIAEKKPYAMEKLAPVLAVKKEVRYEKDTVTIFERAHGK